MGTCLTYTNMLRYLTTIAVALFAGIAASAEPPEQPILRLEPDGPLTFVTSLAYSPDGRTLYEAGWDKIVRVWRQDATGGKWKIARNLTYRVPIAAGLSGAINAIAVSPNGRWLAVGGLGVVRGTSDLRLPGWLAPANAVLTDEMRLDQGVIYLFDTETREARQLREHRGPILALAFAAATAGGPAVLVSAAQEWDAEAKQAVGTVRVWNADTGEHLAGISTALSPQRPALAAWKRGNDAKQTVVAYAWSPDEKLHVWDVERNALQEARDGQYNNTLAYWPAGKRLVSGSTGRVKLWLLDGFPNQPPQVDRELALPNQGVPRALALTSSRDGAAIDRVAVIVRNAAGNQEDHLQVADLATFRLLPSDMILWNGRGTMPALAAVSGRAHIATAGGLAHELVHFPAASPNRETAQVVRATASAPTAAAFVRRGDTVGLQFAREPGRDSAIVYDPRNGWTSGAAGWERSEPDVTGWRIEPGVKTVAITGPRVTQTLVLPDDAEVVSVALLPKAAKVDQPIAAVAWHIRGQPTLQLWDVRSGRPFRELTGHVERVRSLSFSGDGFLLASTANDGTTCLWNLGDFNEILGARGMLPAVLTTRDGRLDVSELVGQAAADGLAVGDRIVGLAEKGKVRNFGSPAEFYLALSHIRPGDPVTLRVERRGTEQDAVVRLVQGIDDRKPLVSLFIDAADNGEPAAWVAWSPLGPFESFGEKADPWIGWHFNAASSPVPAKFAIAAEYRKLHRPGLLAHVLTKHELPREETLPLPKPDLGLWLDGVAPEPVLLDEERSTTVSRDTGKLHLTIDGIDREAIEQVTWQRNDDPPQPLAHVQGNGWEASLAGFSKVRGEQAVRIRLLTHEQSPQVFQQTGLVKFVAPLAELQLGAPYKDVDDDPAFTAQARVRSNSDVATNVEVRLVHRAGDKVLVDEKTTAKDGGDVTHKLTLQQGVNTIVWSARNDLPDAETTVIERVVTYKKRPDPPPQIALQATSGSQAAGRSLAGELQQPWVVEEPVLKIAGTITARGPLSEATIHWADAALKPQALAGFKAGGERVEVKEEIRLRTGRQTIRVRATPENGEPAEVGLIVDYHPQLPTITWRSPAAETVFIAGRDPREVDLRAVVGTTVDDKPFEIVWLRNDKQIDVTTALDLPPRTLGTSAKLERGENRFQIRINNPWRQVRSESLTLYLREPPEVRDVTAAAAKVDKPLTNLTVRVASPADLPPTDVEIAGRSASLGKPAPEKNADGTAIWTYVFRDVPLVEGVNLVSVRARNADGWSLTSKDVQVEVVKRPPKKPEVELLAPAIDTTVDKPEFVVRYEVRSETPLRSIVLLQDGRPRHEVDLSFVKELGENRFESTGETKVTLEPRDNMLELVAVNEGGEASRSRIVTYVPPPVRVLVERLRGTEDANVVLAAKAFAAGAGRFDAAAPKPHMLLEGRIRWGAQADKAAAIHPMLHVRVNGMLQSPVPLAVGDAKSGETLWQAPVCLTAAKDNHIDVELIGIEQDAGSRAEVIVDCADPDTKQRLHLLVVGVNETDANALQTRAMRVVGSQRADGEGLADDALNHGRIYGPLTGEVSSKRIRAQLGRICRAINIVRKSAGGSDVVLFYYRGAEAVSRDGEFYLLTSESVGNPNLKQSAISGEVLSKYFQQSPGAQLLLFDVQRKPLDAGPVDPPGARWPRDTTLAALRYAWTRDGDVPNPARLLVALETAAPKAGTLDRLSDNLEQTYEAARQKVGEGLIYERHVPPGLGALVLAPSP